MRFWDIFKLSLALGLVILVIKNTDIEYILTLRERLSWPWLVIRVLLFFLLILIKSFQYYSLIGNIGYIHVLNVVIWQNAISNFIANSAGIASYMTMLKAEQNVKLTRSGTTFVITKFGDLLAICLYLGFSTRMVWNHIQPLRWLTILMIVGMLIGLGGFLTTIIWRERFVELIVRVLVWLKLDRFSLVTRAQQTLRMLAGEEQKSIFDMLRTSVLLSFVYMSATMILVYASVMLFNVQVGFWPVIYVASLMQLVSFVPIQVLGGLGVTEVTIVYLYSFFGIDPAEMSAVALGLRALFYILNLVVLLYLPLRVLKSKIANRGEI
jgi:uncharacterized protein (TIRG00374 family)